MTRGKHAASAAASHAPSVASAASVADAPPLVPPGRVVLSANLPSLYLELPRDCTVIQPSTGLSVAICQAPPETLLSKGITALPAVVLSGIALALSLRTYFYNQKKDRTARKQSIQDDFWLRKVVSPVSIEPFLAFIGKLCSALPAAAVAVGDVELFWTEQLSEIARFEVAFQTLSLIDKDLLSSVLIRLEYIDDKLAVYVGQLLAHLQDASKPVPDREEATRYMLASSMDLLRLIQTHQTKVLSEA